MTETNYNKTIKELHDAMQSSDEYITKSICEGKKVIALDKNTGLIFIFDFFKGEYSMDFLSKECVDTIVSLVQESDPRTAKTTKISPTCEKRVECEDCTEYETCITGIERGQNQW